MAAPGADRFQNALLAALPPGALALLEPGLEALALPRRLQLELPDRKIEYAYFPETGIASIVAPSAPGMQVEVGIVGREGMTGIAAVHATDRSPYSVYMQVGGAGHRVPVGVVAAAMERSAPCRHVFLAFAQALLIQVSETAVANARGTISQRLARWLLMVQDRVGGPEIPLTHEFLSLMMGARRSGVTEATHELARQGLLAGARGKIVVLDRPGLREHAGRFYGIPESEQKRLFD
jgi:CRP-like cAMP-binding protein